MQAILVVPPLGAVEIPVVCNAQPSRGQAAIYRFDFGDNTSTTSQTPFVFHAYQEPGIYTIALEIEDGNGHRSRTQQAVRILLEGWRDFSFQIPAGSEVPELWKVPFPNDLYMNANGRVHISPEDLEKELSCLGPLILSEGINSLDGFGLTTAVYFPLRNPPLLSSLPGSREASQEPGSSVCLINIDSSSSEFGRRHPIEVLYDTRTQRLIVLPAAGCALQPGTRYAVLLSSSLVSAEGPYVPPEDFLALRDDGSVSTRAADIYKSLWNHLKDTLDFRERTAVSMATVFTTQDTLKDLVAIRSYLETVPPGAFDLADPKKSRIYDTPEELDQLLGVPLVNRPGLDNPGGIAHQHVGTIAVGTYEDLDFRNPSTGTFVFSEDGTPVPQNEAAVPFVIVIPSSPPPPEGYPVVVILHGIGFSMMIVPVLANDFAGAGFVSIGIDIVEQGARFDPRDKANNFTAAPVPDGFADLNPLSPAGFFDAFLRIAGMRENFRQTVVDQIQLVQILKSPDPGLSAIGSPPLDTEHLYYLSDSLGSIIGTQTLAVEPSFEAGVLNVNGGGFMNYLMPNSPVQFADYEGIIRLLAGVPKDDPIDRFSLFVNLVQTVLDGGDSMSYARWILLSPEAAGRGTFTPPDILMIEVVGDQSMPNLATEPLARAMGLELLSPYLTPVAGLDAVPSPARENVSTPLGNVTAALVQYSPATHSDNLKMQFGKLSFYPGFPYPFGPDGPRFPKLPEPITVPEPNAEILDQIKHFFCTNLETGHGEAISTKPPVPLR